MIGGGDWSEDRLIPDLVRSVTQRNPLVIRSPHATRPWQHVLDCLAGYLLLGQRLLEKRGEFSSAWNFSPGLDDVRTVEEVLKSLQEHWPELTWQQTEAPQPHEAAFLYLDDALAKQVLDWRPVWNLDKALRATATWYRRFYAQGVVPTGEQLSEYVDDARSAGVSWAR